MTQALLIASHRIRITLHTFDHGTVELHGTALDVFSLCAYVNTRRTRVNSRMQRRMITEIMQRDAWQCTASLFELQCILVEALVRGKYVYYTCRVEEE